MHLNFSLPRKKVNKIIEVVKEQTVLEVSEIAKRNLGIFKVLIASKLLLTNERVISFFLSFHQAYILKNHGL